MPPKKIPPSTPQQKQKTSSQNASTDNRKSAPNSTNTRPAVPEHEVKKNSSMSAQLALEAAKKAYELRQAAYGAGDPSAREEILAKAINKEIEAESFGKAAKYTRSGAFQGLAAGAGLGVQPGVTVGKLTGALVGGLLSSVGALLGGGVGSAYGAINGPFWDLGQMASHGVRSIVGDFPNWEATSSQKKALEKMVLGAQQTKAPDQDELEQMRDDDGGLNQEDYQQFTSSLSSWIPSGSSMPSMPSMPTMASVPSLSSLPGLGGQSKRNDPTPVRNSTATATKSSQHQQPKAPTKPQAPSKPQDSSARATSQAVTSQTHPNPQKPQDDSQKTGSQTTKPQLPSKKEQNVAKKRPKKLEVRSTSTTSQPDDSGVRRAPPKLEMRNKSVTAKG